MSCPVRRCGMSDKEIFSSDVGKFVIAAERLIHDVRPQFLTDSDRAAVRYYLECLSEKFFSSKAESDESQPVLF
jgi:hypothetical protein